ncbi:hypothetical protein [Mocis latipes granulovirus]|uniref:Uncharacterized protein n=1 Tax=Mocis latipes granulovirus TaxID=2072024 RepID=A0A162GV89_9BBAC|nr:hypothetical protein [Mocis latipes granulovirus]AKR17403.1 hypothetical protein [Mocis latipes granulovirus]
MNDNKQNVNLYDKLPLTKQLDLINCIKRDITMVTSRYERLARIEKDPQETHRKAQVLRETFLLTLADLI